MFQELEEKVLQVGQLLEENEEDDQGWIVADNQVANQHFCRFVGTILHKMDEKDVVNSSRA